MIKVNHWIKCLLTFFLMNITQPCCSLCVQDSKQTKWKCCFETKNPNKYFHKEKRCYLKHPYNFLDFTTLWIEWKCKDQRVRNNPTFVLRSHVPCRQFVLWQKCILSQGWKLIIHVALAVALVDFKQVFLLNMPHWSSSVICEQRDGRKDFKTSAFLRLNDWERHTLKPWLHHKDNYKDFSSCLQRILFLVKLTVAASFPCSHKPLPSASQNMSAWEKRLPASLNVLTVVLVSFKEPYSAFWEFSLCCSVL